MKESALRREVRRASELHPAVYAAMVGLAAWYLISAWISFGTDSGAGYLLGIASLLIAIAIAIPVTIWLSWRTFDGRSRGGRGREERTRSFRDWIACEFETGSGRLRARDAMIQIILPLAAVALGMTAFGIIWHIVSAIAS